jgi:hypothetical protein
MKHKPTPRTAAKATGIAVAMLTFSTLAASAATQTQSTIRQRTTSSTRQPATTTRPATTTVMAGQGNGRGGRGFANVDSNGSTSFNTHDLTSELAALPKATLTKAETDALVFMREEEKLAYDVYSVLYAKWGLRQFSNISKAEATHTSAVKTLLDRYGIKDPAASTKVGAFTNPDLQALYNKLVKQGSVSATDALKVGALIEEVDIADLQKRATTTPDINLVYSNLEKGSRNHLRAFTTGLRSQGVTYVPTVLSKTAYAAIVNSATERGPAN